MKKIEAILLMIVCVVAIVLPVVAIVFGLIDLIINKPETLFMMILGYAGIFTVLITAGYLIHLLLKNPTTASPTRIILSVLAMVLIVKSCDYYSGNGCTPSKYVDCDD